MPQVRFSLDDDTCAYLEWCAKNVLFAKSHNEAARHFVLARIEEIQRRNIGQEPDPKTIRENYTPKTGDDDGKE